MPHYEGTGALYFHLSKDDDRVVLLTAAYITRPPPAYANMGMSRKKTEEIVALGNMGYQNATNAMMATISDLAHSVAVWKKVITRLGGFIDGEDAAVTEKREVEGVMEIIDNLNKLQ
jgi:hypothetical protein